MNLFKIHAVAEKTFYVEADTEEQALELSDEECESRNAFGWNFLQSSAEKVSAARASLVRERRAKMILKP